MTPAVCDAPKPQRIRFSSSLLAAFSSFSMLWAAYAAEPTQKAEVSGGVYVEVTPDGRLKFSADSDDPIPLKDGRFAIKQDGQWSLEKLPRDNPTEVSLHDFAVSWRQYVNHRVLLKSISVGWARLDRVRGNLPASAVYHLPRSAVYIEPAEDQPEMLKYLISNCAGIMPNESACKLDVSGVVENRYGDPHLADGVFARARPQANAKAKAKK